MQYKTIFIHLQ